MLYILTDHCIQKLRKNIIGMELIKQNIIGIKSIRKIKSHYYGVSSYSAEYIMPEYNILVEIVNCSDKVCIFSVSMMFYLKFLASGNLPH